MKNFNLELKIHLDSFKSRRAATTWSVFDFNYTIKIHWIELNSHISYLRCKYVISYFAVIQ